MKSLHALSVLIIVPMLAQAQVVTGTSTVDTDTVSGQVTATCETNLDLRAQAFYLARVLCTLYDSSGTLIYDEAAMDDGSRGYAEVTFSVAGIPGTTYTARGEHSAFAIEEVDTEEPTREPKLMTGYVDPYDFGFYEGIPADALPADYYEWFSPGPPPQAPRQVSEIDVGNTSDTKILYLNIPPIIFHAQQDLSPVCDHVFANVIPGYTNANFFESLLATSIIQYPPGAPNIPANGSGRNLTAYDAETFVLLPGLPINLYPNFYGTKYGLPFPLFQEFVLVHEGVHHYTGWYDNSLGGTPNFVQRFYSSGFRPASYGTSEFTYWINAGCPAASGP